MPITAEPIYYPKPGNSRLVARNSQVRVRCDGNGGPDGPTKKVYCDNVIAVGERILAITWTPSTKVTRHCRECALNHFRVRFLEDPKG